MVASLEEKREIVVDSDDMKNVEVFCSHFGIPVPERLKDAIKKYNDNPEGFSLKDQEEFKVAFCFMAMTANHDIMKSDVWEGLLMNCDDVYASAEFDKEFEEIIGADGEDKS